MSLQEGDFFEGVYQLKKEVGNGAVNEGLRWAADDFGGSQRSQVIIDILPIGYDAKLHWETEINGLLKAGQSVGNDSRYFVWEKGEEKTLFKLSAGEASEQEKEKFVKIIAELDIAPDEAIISTDIPEFWHTEDQQVLLFYRKQVSQHANPRQNAEVLHFWKKIISPDYISPPKPTPPPSLASPEILKNPQEIKTFLATAGWRGTLIVIGLLLATAAYLLKPDTDKTGDSAYLNSFNQALNKGIAYEKRGEYEQAVEAFKSVTQLPASDVAQQRLDSLGYAYESYAFMECQKYKSTDSTNLFFIPDQYFHYASILTATPTRKCE